MGWGQCLVIADTPEAGRDWLQQFRTQCPAAVATFLPDLAPEYWAAVVGVDCSGVTLCNLCGRLACPGCGQPVVVFVLAKSAVTACAACLGHGPEHYAHLDHAGEGRRQALERLRARRNGPNPGFQGP